MNGHTITTLSVLASSSVHNVTRTFQLLLFISLFQTFQLLPIHGQNAKRHSDNRGAFLSWDLWWTWEAKGPWSVNLQRGTHIWPFEQVGLPSAWWRRHPRRLEGECGGALVAQEGHAPSGGGKLGQEGLTDERSRTRSWERARPVLEGTTEEWTWGPERVPKIAKLWMRKWSHLSLHILNFVRGQNCQWWHQEHHRIVKTVLGIF